jgi:hypothetical protein
MQTRHELEKQVRKTGQIANVTIGRPLTHPSASSHTAGIREGNRVRPAEQKRGLIELDALNARGTAERSTGINADRRNPIDRRSPNLSPA